MLQSCTSISAPTHNWPLFLGLGLVQLRRLCFLPPPQFRSQVEKEAQFAQLPSTESERQEILEYLTNSLYLCYVNINEWY